MTWAQLSHGLTYDYTTGKFPNRLTVEMLAGSLSGISRYNAWTNPNWSVASHACLVAEIIAAMADYGPEVVLDGLHHDDKECLVGDMLQPMKESLTEATRAELSSIGRRAQRAIADELGLPTVAMAAFPVVHQADIAALEAERRILFSYRMSWPTESIVNPKMLAAGTKIMAGDFGKITGGYEAAQRYVSHHNALMLRILGGK